MTIEKEIFEAFLGRLRALLPKEDGSLEDMLRLAREVVVGGLDDKQTLIILNRHKLNIPQFGELLKEPAAFIETVKILALMETVDNWTEFEGLNKRRKERNKKPEPIPEGFDKILKGIMKVPKPKDDKEGTTSPKS